MRRSRTVTILLNYRTNYPSREFRIFYESTVILVDGKLSNDVEIRLKHILGKDDVDVAKV